MRWKKKDRSIPESLKSARQMGVPRRNASKLISSAMP